MDSLIVKTFRVKLNRSREKSEKLEKNWPKNKKKRGKDSDRSQSNRNSLKRRNNLELGLKGK